MSGLLCSQYARPQTRKSRQSRPTKKLGNPAIAIAAIVPGQFDHVGNQAVLVFRAPGTMALRGTVLAKHAAGMTLGDAKPAAHMVNAVPSAGRA
jgi:hypothetical protein